MRRIFPLLAFVPFAFFSSGCVHALMARSQPTDVKLKLRTSDPEQHVVRVALESPVDYPVSANGRVQFTMPSFRNGCSVYFLGIKTHDGSAELLRAIELRRGERVVRRLSLAQVAQLPEDTAGYRIVKIGH